MIGESNVQYRFPATVLVTVLGCQAATLAPSAAADDVVGQPGPHNAITDVPGIRVGQVQSDTAPFLTGTTVVYTPEMSVGSVDQRGGAPATQQTDILTPVNANPGVNASNSGGPACTVFPRATGGPDPGSWTR